MIQRGCNRLYRLLQRGSNRLCWLLQRGRNRLCWMFQRGRNRLFLLSISTGLLNFNLSKLGLNELRLKLQLTNYFIIT